MNTSSTSFARSVLALQIFSKKIIRGVQSEFLAWPVIVMSDWASTCSLFRQSVILLGRSFPKNDSSSHTFAMPAEDVQDHLRCAWSLTEEAFREFSDVTGDVNQRIDCAGRAEAFLKRAQEESLTPLALAAAPILDLDESDLAQMSPRLLAKVYYYLDDSADGRDGRPEWERFYGYLGALDFAIRYNDRLKICMLTRQMLMHWLHNSVDPTIYAAAGPMTHRLFAANLRALWRLERPGDFDELDALDFRCDSIEGRAVFDRYQFFRSILSPKGFESNDGLVELESLQVDRAAASV